MAHFRHLEQITLCPYRANINLIRILLHIYTACLIVQQMSQTARLVHYVCTCTFLTIHIQSEDLYSLYKLTARGKRIASLAEVVVICKRLGQFCSNKKYLMKLCIAYKHEKFEQDWLTTIMYFIVSFLSILCFKRRRTVHYNGKIRIQFLSVIIKVFTCNRHSLTLVELEKWIA